MKDQYQEFREYRDRLKAGGGPAKIERQHQKGKLTARERLDILFDPGTFVEYGLFARHRCTEFGMEKVEIPGDGVVTGFGKVDGRTVYAFAQDFTAAGGSLGEMQGAKIRRIMEEAIRAGAPVIGLNDSGGARIQEGNDSAVQYFGIFSLNVEASGYIPQISAIMGPCAGGAAYSPGLTDFVINVKETSSMFVTGPGVVKQVTGEVVSSEELGGAQIHNTVSGVSHMMAEDDRDCIEKIKRYLSYFPSNCHEEPPVYKCDADPMELCYALDAYMPESSRKPYDCRGIVEIVADPGSVFEIQPGWACNVVTALARMNGHSVGFVANQPNYMAGSLDVHASDKIAHFVTLCDAFNIPLLFLGDTAGCFPGLEQEHGGIIRHGAKALYAVAQAAVPKILITTRKLYGGAAAAMCDYGMGGDARISWPAAESSSMGASAAVGSIFAKDIKKADDPEQKEAALIQEYASKYSTPCFKAGRLYTDMIIMPHETRKVLNLLLEALRNKKRTVPDKRHGIPPV